ncbi:putative ankyrin repeat-containing protein, conserved [Neospora caninum Liverpool]|uniref:Ankyrin repeat-containing protein, conserved,putative n=1 Tax=Neospora caninum (strain Liverpool) TaxID=572307 RepID=F0VCE7_NEOCL|nr:putative ankyrin repeat-containing protein, conserved [Neospora caninum Liverpool]CBZ51269.1 putative ankyrin repeat-containing protein, conserved [Neospora caninum Liverpool]CEL68584.1 TPA: ankyrin repeat-containing protein, conserved,putative [Neospora caninum Liverpool]|eukprot:XP_003881302.1 putative ankyrin repeat-containing protein, conserved [Neospora caninum Liverpool]
MLVGAFKASRVDDANFCLATADAATQADLFRRRRPSRGDGTPADASSEIPERAEADPQARSPKSFFPVGGKTAVRGIARLERLPPGAQRRPSGDSGRAQAGSEWHPSGELRTSVAEDQTIAVSRVAGPATKGPAGRRQAIARADSEESPAGVAARERPGSALRSEMVKKIEASEEEERRKDERELDLLRSTIPKLLGRQQYSDAEALLDYYLDAFPSQADLYILAADVSLEQKKFTKAIEFYWGALFCVPENRMLVRSLRAAEEERLAEVTCIPHLYKAALFDSARFASCHTTARPYGAGDTYFSRARASDPQALSSCSALADPTPQALAAEIGRCGALQRPPFIVVKQAEQTLCIAEVAIEPGQLVFRELPYVCTPLTLEEGGQIFTTCFHCLRERPVSDRGFSCPVSPHACPFVFCSWDCLMHNVRVHSRECALLPMIMAAAREADLSVTVVLHVCRVLLRAGLEREIVRPEKDTLFDVLGELQSHEASVQIGQPELYRKVTTLARRLEKDFPPGFYCFLQHRELRRLTLLVSQYSPFVRSTSPSAAVQRRDPDASVGLVFSRGLANFQHSCVPTCTYNLDEDGYVSVRALCHIPVGGRLCISMVEDLFAPTVARKGLDALPRVFGCGCVRCSDPTEGGRMLRGVRCGVCLRGYCAPFKSPALQKRLVAYGVGGAQVARKIALLESAFEKPKARRKSSTLDDDTDGSEEERWQCAACGNASDLLAVQCDTIEREVAQLAKKAERRLVKGETLPARKIYVDIIRRFSSRLHPNNFMLYNAQVIAAGLLFRNPGQDVPQALVCIRRAVIAAEAVLPICHREKIHLYNQLAQISFAASMVDKLSRRGVGLPGGFILEPMYASLWNAVVCCGPRSVLALTALQQLRMYAAALNVATPPAVVSYKLPTVGVIFSYFRHVLGRHTDSDKTLRRLVEKDPFRLATAIARLGLHCLMSLEILSAFNDVHHLATGLSIMAIAASQSRLPLVRKLLDAGFDFLRGNELGVTPLVAMAAMPLPQGVRPAAGSAKGLDVEGRSSEQRAADRIDRSGSGRTRDSGRGDAETDGIYMRSEEADRADRDQAEILRLFMQECSRRDARGKASTTKEQFMLACTHRILGLNGPLHFAAARGKTELCRQLIRSGWSVNKMNGEGAVPLHLACASGDVQTVLELLSPRIPRVYANAGEDGKTEGSAALGTACGTDVNVKTERGETPLMLAAYALQRDMVQLLLDRGADPNMVGDREKMTVLHALATGVCRTVEVQFEPLDPRQDLAANVVMGFNLSSLAANVYNKGAGYLHVTDRVEDRIPVVSRLAPDLLIFPREILRRLTEANHIGEILLRHCNPQLFVRKTKKGYTPAELLAHLWERFFQIRNAVAKQSELRLAAASQQERQDIETGWKVAGQLAFRLVELLRAGGAKVEDVRRPEDMTPRQHDLQERRRRQLQRDAPWLRAEELLRGRQAPLPATAQPSAEASEDKLAEVPKTGDAGKAPVAGKEPPSPPQAKTEPAESGEKKGPPPPPLGEKKGPPPPPLGEKKGPPPPPLGEKKGPPFGQKKAPLLLGKKKGLPPPKK